MKECVVVYNPQSGKRHKDFIKKIPSIVEEYGYKALLIYTEYKNHATDIVAELPDTIDLVISIGGDGTFNETVTGNLKRKKRLLLAHLPAGTTNDIGAIYGYKDYNNIEENLRLVLEGEDKKIDLGLINDKPFVYVAGFGKFLNVAYETPRVMKKNLGYLAYIGGGIKEFFRGFKLYEVEIEAEGKVTRSFYSFGLISNANRIAGINQFYKEVKLNDGKLEFLFSNIARHHDLVKVLFHYAKGDVTNAPGLFFYRTDHMIVRFIDKAPAWCLDGEYNKEKIRRYEIKVDHNFTIRIPRSCQKELFIKDEEKR